MKQLNQAPYRIPMRITSSNGVSAGSTTTYDLPIGFKYLSFDLVIGGTVDRSLVMIRHRINGEVIQEYSAADRDAMNQHDNLPDEATAGVLFMPMSPENMKTRDAEEMTGINTGSRDQNGRYISKYTVEIDVPGSATSPTLDLFADTDEASVGGPGLIPRLLKFPYDLNAGQRQLREFPKGGVKFARLRRIYIKAATADISEMEVKIDQKVHFERTDVVNRAAQTRGRRNPQAGWYVIDRTEKGYGGDPYRLTGVNDFALILEVGTTQANCPIYMDYIGGFAN
ncbi:major capsid protein P2 [Marinobacter salarius]|uniref:major capsid protein P2 n=1 Tax=Marinobacter salarius TaxID=1420917 RepID=UPI003D0B6ACC